MNTSGCGKRLDLGPGRGFGFCGEGMPMVEYCSVCAPTKPVIIPPLQPHPAHDDSANFAIFIKHVDDKSGADAVRRDRAEQRRQGKEEAMEHMDAALAAAEEEGYKRAQGKTQVSSDEPIGKPFHD